MQQRQRSNAATKYRHTGKNDAARAKAVDPAAQQWRAQAHCDRADCEAARNGFAAPAEFCTQRFTKTRKWENKERAEPRHHAETRRQDDAPAVIAEIEFTQFGCVRTLIFHDFACAARHKL